MRQGLLIKPRTHRCIYQFCSVCVCGSPVSSFWGWNYRWVIKPTWHLHGFWRSEFIPCLILTQQTFSHWAISFLPKLIFNWKYFLFEFHGFKSCHYLEMTIQISVSLVYTSRKTSKHVNGQVKSGCGVRGTQQSWNLAEWLSQGGGGVPKVGGQEWTLGGDSWASVVSMRWGQHYGKGFCLKKNVYENHHSVSLL